jgi:hypothetical protein
MSASIAECILLLGSVGVGFRRPSICLALGSIQAILKLIFTGPWSVNVGMFVENLDAASKVVSTTRPDSSLRSSLPLPWAASQNSDIFPEGSTSNLL